MTTTINAGNGTMDFSQMAYRLAVVTGLIFTPEAARKLTDDSFSGARFIVQEVIEDLHSMEGKAEFLVEIPAYKLSAVAGLLDTVERAAELGHDVWSGVRLLLEEVTAALLDGDVVMA